ncbi:NifU family protein [Tsukamurella soli]|uniref:NifU family protein n=1 Tax=Tsukamurella soli TaxID=644556 RepID=UPI00360ADFCF
MTDQLELQSTELESLAERLDTAMSDADGLAADARAVFDAAVESLGALHKQGLTTIIRTLRADARGKELLFALVDDPTVRMLFAMHGLIRQPPEALARRVLDRIRPGLQGHGGDVELSHIDGSVAFVRLTGACNGCSMAAVTMRDSVESALTAGVPEITSVEVLPNEPAPAFIPLTSLRAPHGATTPAAPRTRPPNSRRPGGCERSPSRTCPWERSVR